MRSWHSAARLATGAADRPLRCRTPVSVEATLSAIGRGAGSTPEIAAMSLLQASARRCDRDRSLRGPSRRLGLGWVGMSGASSTPEVGCLPARSARRRAWTSLRGRPTLLPPATGPRHGRAIPRPRVSAYAPQRSHQVILPVITIRWVTWRSEVSVMALACTALAHSCWGGTVGAVAAVVCLSCRGLRVVACTRRSAGLESRHVVPSGAV